MAYMKGFPPGVSTTVLLVGAAQFCNFRGPFDKKGSPRKGAPNPKKSECFLRLLTLYMARWRLCRHFGTFWTTEKDWARITAKSRKFVW